MPSEVKYDTAFRERAVRLVQERRSEYGEESLKRTGFSSDFLKENRSMSVNKFTPVFSGACGEDGL